VTVYDGKTHPVDGKEIAFVIAGRKATIEAIRAAAPIVLEPVVEIEIIALKLPWVMLPVTFHPGADRLSGLIRGDKAAWSSTA